jgi:hypothetical protein
MRKGGKRMMTSRRRIKGNNGNISINAKHTDNSSS